MVSELMVFYNGLMDLLWESQQQKQVIFFSFFPL